MTNDVDEQIRQRAHAIWESEGRPDGRHEEHWLRAREQIEVLTGISGAGAVQKTPVPGSSTGTVPLAAGAKLRRGRGSSDTATAMTSRATPAQRSNTDKPKGRSPRSPDQPLGGQPSELGVTRGRRASSPPAPKYRHPENPELTWSGRGRRPGWIRDAVGAGRSLSDFEIGA